MQKCGVRKFEPRREASCNDNKTPVRSENLSSPRLQSRDNLQHMQPVHGRRYRGDWPQGMHCVHALLPCLQVSPDEVSCNPTPRRDRVPSSPARSDAVVHQGPARIVGLHYGTSVSGRPKSTCRRGGQCSRRDDSRARRAMSGRATASDETRGRRSRTARDRTGNDSPGACMHACLGIRSCTIIIQDLLLVLG